MRRSKIDQYNQDQWNRVVAERDALATQVEELKAKLAEANEPQWFWVNGHEDSGEGSIWEATEYLDLEPGKHVVRVYGAREVPSIWCVLTIHEDGEWVNITEHETEEAARAAAAIEQEGG